MKTKIKLSFIMNIIFYIFIFINKEYIDDNVPQIIFYMALSFSSILIEEVYRNNMNCIKIYIKVDIFIRIVALLVHFITICFHLNKSYAIKLTLILLVINIILELIINYKMKFIKVEEKNNVNLKEIDDFIFKYKNNELLFRDKSNKLKSKIEKCINMLEVSGKENFILCILFLLIFISRFIYTHHKALLFIPIISIATLIYIMFNINRNQNKKQEIVFLFIGYMIIILSEVFLLNKLGIFLITIRMIGLVFFIPLIRKKCMLRKEIEKIYEQYKNN